MFRCIGPTCGVRSPCSPCPSYSSLNRVEPCQVETLCYLRTRSLSLSLFLEAHTLRTAGTLSVCLFVCLSVCMWDSFWNGNDCVDVRATLQRHNENSFERERARNCPLRKAHSTSSLNYPAFRARWDRCTWETIPCTPRGEISSQRSDISVT